MNKGDWIKKKADPIWSGKIVAKSFDGGTRWTYTVRWIAPASFEQVGVSQEELESVESVKAKFLSAAWRFLNIFGGRIP